MHHRRLLPLLLLAATAAAGCRPPRLATGRGVRASRDNLHHHALITAASLLEARKRGAAADDLIPPRSDSRLCGQRRIITRATRSSRHPAVWESKGQNMRGPRWNGARCTWTSCRREQLICRPLPGRQLSRPAASVIAVRGLRVSSRAATPLGDHQGSSFAGLVRQSSPPPIPTSPFLSSPLLVPAPLRHTE